jgi:signal transduction histidine kinase
VDFLRKDGSTRTFQGNTFPFLSSEGQTIGLIGISRDITDRKMAEEEKVSLKEEMIETLKETDLLKDQFLSILSHELRTPINSITGYASILDDEVAGSLSEVQHQYLRKILTGADNLMALVEDLLDISRVQAGKFTVTPEWTDFREVALSVIENLTPLADRRHLILLDEVPADLPPVLADGRRIGQVLNNLVINAIKFTPQNGKISVRAFLEGGALRCEVKDMGIGITREDIPRLFKRFSQLDMSSTRKAGGTGLGLSIANAIIEAHGGKIGVESEVGQGSSFWFSIPTKWLGVSPTVQSIR